MGGGAFIGRVVSNRMQKSVVVSVNYVVWNSRYKVYQRRMARHMAHDEKQRCIVGDIVRIQACRKLSKHKSYRVMTILKQTQAYDPSQAKAMVAQRQATGPRDWVAVAEETKTEAQLRLHALREMYLKELGSSSMTGDLLKQTAAELAGGQQQQQQQQQEVREQQQPEQGEQQQQKQAQAAATGATGIAAGRAGEQQQQ